MMSSNQTRTQVSNFLDLLTKTGIAIYTNPVMEKNFPPRITRVSWPDTGTTETFRSEFASLEEFKNWLRHNSFSAILFDGSILQFSFFFDGALLVKHRLAYFPCPINVTSADLAEFPLLDVLEASPIESFRFRSPIRFDYDPDAFDMGHPRSHLTICSPHCRLPVQSPLSLGHFVQFIFKNFYPEQWKDFDFLRTNTLQQFSRSIDPVEELGLHVSWRQELRA